MKKHFIENKALNNKRSLLAYIGLAILILLDQITKIVIDHQLSETDRISVIPNFLYLDKTYNRGAAFSFLAGHDWGIYLLSAVSLIAGVFFVYLIYRAKSNLGKYLFTMLAAGTIGNGIDRVLNGYVLDFISAHFGSYIFPTFNVADCYLTVHVLLLLLLVLAKKYDPESDLDFTFDQVESAEPKREDRDE